MTSIFIFFFTYVAIGLHVDSVPSIYQANVLYNDNGMISRI